MHLRPKQQQQQQQGSGLVSAAVHMPASTALAQAFHSKLQKSGLEPEPVQTAAFGLHRSPLPVRNFREQDCSSEPHQGGRGGGCEMNDLEDNILQKDATNEAVWLRIALLRCLIETPPTPRYATGWRVWASQRPADAVLSRCTEQ